ncbi:MAG: hypothetical protein ACFB2Z_01440 [Maricaulaceae bacterium]
MDPLVLLYLLLGLGAIAAGLRAWLGYRGLQAEAQAEWPVFAQRFPQDAAGVNAEGFIKAYARAHGPRGFVYLAIALGIVMLVTPLALTLTYGVWGLLYQIIIAGYGGPDAVPPRVVAAFEPGYLLAQFVLFFGCAGAWVGSLWFLIRRFHRNRPGKLAEELAMAKGAS